ncbi:MAG: M1 family aminopeptidase, partial [Chryseobacterium artocarpi]
REMLKICTEKKVKFTDELFLNLAEKYLDKDITYFFQKHIINGEDIDLVNEKWMDGIDFQITDHIPQIQIDRNKEVKYGK